MMHDLIELWAERRGSGGVAQNGLRTAQDPGEQVVKIMGDAARQHTQALPALGIQQRALEGQAGLFGLFALSNIGVDGDDAQDLHPDAGSGCGSQRTMRSSPV